MEEQIKTAAKLYKCRDKAKNLLKELYPEKIKPCVSLINAVAKSNKLDTLQAVLIIGESKVFREDGFAMILLMAAAVEIIESSKDNKCTHEPVGAGGVLVCSKCNVLIVEH
jgi:hypothetical protein